MKLFGNLSRFDGLMIVFLILIQLCLFYYLKPHIYFWHQCVSSLEMGSSLVAFHGLESNIAEVFGIDLSKNRVDCICSSCQKNL